MGVRCYNQQVFFLDVQCALNECAQVVRQIWPDEQQIKTYDGLLPAAVVTQDEGACLQWQPYSIEDGISISVSSQTRWPVRSDIDSSGGSED